MTRFEFKLPDIGEGIAEAEIVAWHVKPGDVVEEDAPIADMMTDKATVEMSSPVSGRVVETNGAVGDNVAIGSVLAVFETAGSAQSDEASRSSRTQSREGEADKRVSTASASSGQASRDMNGSAEGQAGKVLASPAVRKRAMDLGVDLAQVKPGTEGRIRHADLDAYLRYARDRDAPALAGGDSVTEVKVTGIRRRIAENMAASKRHIPHFAYVEEVDVTVLEALRAAMNETRGERPRLTPLPFLVKAIVLAVPEHPMVNATYDDEKDIVFRHSAVHIGMATQTEAGLTVPVIRHAERLDIWALAREIARLSKAVRQGSATRQEMTGSTITITSLGALGGIASTPVINRPEVAIVGVNRIVERPAVIDGRIEVRKLMNLSSSFDHRVVDGWDAALFIQSVKRLIENPALILAG